MGNQQGVSVTRQAFLKEVTCSSGKSDGWFRQQLFHFVSRCLAGLAKESLNKHDLEVTTGETLILLSLAGRKTYAPFTMTSKAQRAVRSVWWNTKTASVTKPCACCIPSESRNEIRIIVRLSLD